jgi:plastocyanin
VRAQMDVRLLTLSACAALVALTGCGSSGSSSSSSSGASATATGGASTSSTSSAQTKEGSFKVTTTPKFAPASGPVRSGTVPIAYRNIAIEPDTVRVKLGSTIRWTNHDNIEHNVTSERGQSKIDQQSFASKGLGEGATFEIKALKLGVIHYECTIHPASMNGTIEVVR